MDFQFELNRKGENVTLILSGRLDTLSANDLANKIKEINASSFDAVEVEMSKLSYISSSGLRCFMELFKGSKNHGAAFTIVGIQPAVREIFDLTGFSKIFGLN